MQALLSRFRLDTSLRGLTLAIVAGIVVCAVVSSQPTELISVALRRAALRLPACVASIGIAFLARAVLTAFVSATTSRPSCCRWCGRGTSAGVRILPTDLVVSAP